MDDALLIMCILMVGMKMMLNSSKCCPTLRWSHRAQGLNLLPGGTDLCRPAAGGTVAAHNAGLHHCTPEPAQQDLR